MSRTSMDLLDGDRECSAREAIASQQDARKPTRPCPVPPRERPTPQHTACSTGSRRTARPQKRRARMARKVAKSGPSPGYSRATNSCKQTYPERLRKAKSLPLALTGIYSIAPLAPTLAPNSDVLGVSQTITDMSGDSAERATVGQNHAKKPIDVQKRRPLTIAANGRQKLGN